MPKTYCLCSEPLPCADECWQRVRVRQVATGWRVTWPTDFAFGEQLFARWRWADAVTFAYAKAKYLAMAAAKEALS